jgi:hypothetical protein
MPLWYVSDVARSWFWLELGPLPCRARTPSQLAAPVPELGKMTTGPLVLKTSGRTTPPREWGQAVAPVHATTVKNVGAVTAASGRPWTDAEWRRSLALNGCGLPRPTRIAGGRPSNK